MLYMLSNILEPNERSALYKIFNMFSLLCFLKFDLLRKQEFVENLYFS